MYKYTDIKIYKYTNIKICKYTNVQIYRYTNIQIYKYTNIQTYETTNIQILKPDYTHSSSEASGYNYLDNPVILELTPSSHSLSSTCLSPLGARS